MPNPAIHETRHTVTIAAPPDTVYRLIADVSGWPHTFSPTVHVQRIEGDERRELLRIWAFANGEVRDWTSRRELDPVARRISFRQEISSPPVTGMGGEWVLRDAGAGRTEVVFRHDFSVQDNDPAHVAWVTEAIDRNTGAELAALRTAAELGAARDELVFSFADSVLIRGSVPEVYDFIYRADAWQERLPHVERLVLTEEVPNVQTVEMDTRANDGSTHTTKSVRICYPDSSIVYKQTTVPPIMSAHTGQWWFREIGGLVEAESRHTVVLDPGKVAEILGEDTPLGTARDRVRSALGSNSLATLGIAKQAVEASHV